MGNREPYTHSSASRVKRVTDSAYSRKVFASVPPTVRPAGGRTGGLAHAGGGFHSHRAGAIRSERMLWLVLERPWMAIQTRYRYARILFSYSAT